MVAIRTIDKYSKSGQCHCGHSRAQEAGATTDSVNVTIGTNYKSRQCRCDHRYELQESTVPLWPSTVIADSAMVAIGTKQQATTIADSVMVTIGTNKEEPTVLM
jgi:hypothetical protein